MRLADLRKLSVRNNLKIRFQLPEGLECVITEHGIAQIPSLRRAPGFNLEQELASIGEFILEPAAESKRPAPPRRVGREEMASLLSSPAAGASAEHEEE